MWTGALTGEVGEPCVNGIPRIPGYRERPLLGPGRSPVDTERAVALCDPRWVLKNIRKRVTGLARALHPRGT